MAQSEISRTAIYLVEAGTSTGANVVVVLIRDRTRAEDLENVAIRQFDHREMLLLFSCREAEDI